MEIYRFKYIEVYSRRVEHLCYNSVLTLYIFLFFALSACVKLLGGEHVFLKKKTD